MADTNPDPDLAAFGWPPLLPTARAVAYTGCSRHALMRAIRSGALTPAGRRSRSYIFRRADLDQWLIGVDGAEADDRPAATITPINGARRRTPISDSLARIRAAAGRPSDSDNTR